MDKFFSQKYCDRCGGDLSSGRTMSMFNTDCICMECKAKEQKLPEYKAATDAERKAVIAVDGNFKGVGYPKKQ